MEKNISKLTDGELESLGYKLYETKEQQLAQIQQVNQNLLMIRGEKQARAAKKEEKVVQPVAKTPKAKN